MQRKRLPLGNRLALLYEFFGNFGTQRMAAGGRLGFLVGVSGPCILGQSFRDANQRIWDLSGNTRQEYRLHDYMISGSLFDNQAPFVLKSIRYKNGLEAGFAFYSKKWRLLTLWNSISKDNELQVTARHPYLNISIARFF